MEGLPKNYELEVFISGSEEMKPVLDEVESAGIELAEVGKEHGFSSGLEVVRNAVARQDAAYKKYDAVREKLFQEFKEKNK